MKQFNDIEEIVIRGEKGMNNIVIVEDRLGRGISLAGQFKEFSVKHPEYQIEVSTVCYFCKDEQKAKRDIEKQMECGFNIRHVTLGNFIESMDEYLYCPESRTFLIMDYILEGDGSEGAPMRRVNIRYSKNKGQLATNQLWFYTATSARNVDILREHVGEEHTFIVTDVDTNYLRLDLDNEKFLEEIVSTL